MPGEIQGELSVIGTNSIKIDLLRKEHPKHVSVSFKGKPPLVPCDDHHHHEEDELKWLCEKDICERNDNFHLIIMWRVESPRDIEWEIEW